MKVGFITNFIVNLLMMLVAVTLLPGLGNLQVLSYNSNLLFSFIDHFRTEEWPLSGFRPTQRSPTFSSIENLKGSHLPTSLITVVVGELGEGKILFPTFTEGDETCPKHVLQNLVYPFGLTISLKMISRTEGETGSHSSLEVLPESRQE